MFKTQGSFVYIWTEKATEETICVLRTQSEDPLEMSFLGAGGRLVTITQGAPKDKLCLLTLRGTLGGIYPPEGRPKLWPGWQSQTQFLG